MAYTGAEGTYLKSTDITNNLALAFINVPSADLGEYFDYADAMVENIALKNNILPASIAVDGNGKLYDVNLREYALACFYIKLFSDKTGKQNSMDSGNLSSSGSYDKYEVQINRYRDALPMYTQSITGNTITNTASESRDLMGTIEMMRG